METGKWYRAKDHYDRGNGFFYNYFIDLGDDKFAYYSISLKHPDYPFDFSYIEDDYDTVKDDILDNFEFEEVDKKFIIRDCFT